MMGIVHSRAAPRSSVRLHDALTDGAPGPEHERSARRARGLDDGVLHADHAARERRAASIRWCWMKNLRRANCSRSIGQPITRRDPGDGSLGVAHARWIVVGGEPTQTVERDLDTRCAAAAATRASDCSAGLEREGAREMPVSFGQHRQGSRWRRSCTTSSRRALPKLAEEGNWLIDDLDADAPQDRRGTRCRRSRATSSCTASGRATASGRRPRWGTS